MKTRMRLVGLCLLIPAVVLPVCADEDTSNFPCQSKESSVADLSPDVLTEILPADSSVVQVNLCAARLVGDASFSTTQTLSQPDTPAKSSSTPGNRSGQGPKIQPSGEGLRPSKPDFNQGIYYKGKLEFSLDAGWLPINIPFPFDVFEGDAYDLYPLRYTLVPMILSLRWHLNDIWGLPVWRGNWDLTFSGSATLIPRGPETRYFSYDMGIRHNEDAPPLVET